MNPSPMSLPYPSTTRRRAAPDEASQQAVNLKRVLLADGWTDR